MAPILIHLWSGPRNVSTALMYSFAQRSDTRVVDEPLYAHYLRVSNAQHPGREQVLAAQDSDGNQVVKNRILGEWDRPVVFFKQMTHHLVDLDRAFLRKGLNVLLTRDPLDMLPSLAVQIPQPTLRDTGYAAQSALLDELVKAGQNPPVLDARELLLDPEGVLKQLCARLKLPFEPAMLHWSAGPRPEDGVWARHWYQVVHKSTGFEPYRAKTGNFPERLRPLLDECLRPYAHVATRALRARPARDRE